VALAAYLQRNGGWWRRGGRIRGGWLNHSAIIISMIHQWPVKITFEEKYNHLAATRSRYKA